MIGPEPQRPDPDILLRNIQNEERRAVRGRLKIFLGYAPRVGKSLRMFEEGIRRKQRGQDVVVGAVQDRGAEDLTDLLRRLEVIPFRDGAVDVEAIRRRNPQVCLIDELAHRNPESTPNRYRWEDVQQLLDAGINVVSAINLQHILEQQDAVERITGRRAATGIPIGFLESADELTIVDSPTHEIASEDRRGLSAAQCSELREIALLVAANVVDRQLLRYLDVHGLHAVWSTQERVLVCLTPRSSVRAMLDSATRVTNSFHGAMLAVYVMSRPLSPQQKEALEANLSLAKEMGAEVHILEDSDPVGAIVRFARQQRITQLFIGHTHESRWRFWRQRPIERLLDETDGMDIRLFPGAA